MAWTKEAREKAALTRKNSGATNQYSKAKLENTPIPVNPNKGKPGTFKGKFHSEETKQTMRDSALASPHRRLRRKLIVYKGITLDSSWELDLAQRLDVANIEWIRPKPIKWKCELGLEHNYFPDFYLPEHDLYVDPKNPYAYKVQQKKINVLKEQIPNLVFLCSIEEITNFALMVKQEITRVF